MIHCMFPEQLCTGVTRGKGSRLCQGKGSGCAKQAQDGEAGQGHSWLRLASCSCSPGEHGLQLPRYLLAPEGTRWGWGVQLLFVSYNKKNVKDPCSCHLKTFIGAGAA